MSEEPIIIVTMRIEDQPIPRTSSVEGKCDDCNNSVHISETTLPRMQEFPHHRLLCTHCVAPKLIKDGPPAEMFAADPRFQRFVDSKKDSILSDLITGYPEEA